MSVILADPLLDTKEAAMILKANERTLANWRAVGEGPDYVKIGRLVRYTKSSLERYKKQHTVRLNDNAGRISEDKERHEP